MLFKMKYIFLLLLVITSLSACHTTTIGYLRADGASFNPDSLIIRKELDPDDPTDRVRIQNNAPWVTTKIQGMLGTAPINYRLLNVKATEGGDASVFRQEITVRGIGIMQVPLKFNAPKGRYLISLEVYNEDHTAELKDIFTFIVQ